MGGGFDAPQLVGIPTGHNEGFVVVTPDELTLFYSSDDPSGLGGYDIYMVKRSTKADGWGTPQRQDALNTSGHDVVSWISPDGCDIYLERAVAAGNKDIFVATRGQ